jgi:PAS domain S-box-containing protein
LIGAVNVYPATDSLVRWFPYAEAFAAGTIPTLASRMVGFRSSNTGEFYLDYGIRIRDLPHLSYIDALREQFDPNAISGKNVLIGATAVELGDQFAVPIYQVLAGSMLQALAYESLVQDRALHRVGPLPSIAIAALILVMFSAFSATWEWRHHLLALTAVWGTLFTLTFALAALTPISIDVAIPAVAVLAYCWLGWLRQLEQQARLLLQQRVAETRRRAVMQSVLEDSFDGILVADENGIIEMANAAAGRVLGRTPNDMLGMPVPMLLPVTLPAAEQPFAEYADAEDDFTIAPMSPTEIELPHPAGGTLVLEMVLSRSRVAIRSNARKDGIFLTYTFRDISERRRAEEALRTAMHEALAANQAKSEFLANMSHELRTPLNAIHGFAEMMRDEMFGPVGNERYKSYAADITSSSEHLIKIISDILDLSKAEAGLITPENSLVRVSEVVDMAVRLTERHAAERQVAIRLDLTSDLDTRPIETDHGKLTQILLNLLSNSVKFTKPDGAITIAGRFSQNFVEIAVRDTGIGIAPADLAKVMAPFGQVASAYQTHEGFGLGLPLTKRLTEALGGSFTLRSVLGEGTTAIVRLPCIPVESTSREDSLEVVIARSDDVGTVRPLTAPN